MRDRVPPISPPRFSRLVVKALIAFVLFNGLYLIAQPMGWLNRISVYGWLTPARERFAFADFPAESYSLSLDNLDQLFASHVIVQAKAPDEFRVVLLGDSGVWGYLLAPTETQAACLDRQADSLPTTLLQGRRPRYYNLAYPKLTVTKDLLILRRALAFQPDLIVWQTTLASLYPRDQLGFALIAAHREELAALRDQFALNLPEWGSLAPPNGWYSLWERSFVAQRRSLADWLRYQLYGVGWGATQVDHVVAKFVAPHATRFAENADLFSVNVVALQNAGQISAADVALDVVAAGVTLGEQAGVPVWVINEPTYQNPDANGVRLNTFYPRWAYTAYRDLLRTEATRRGWQYADLGDAAPNDHFTDTDFHLTAQGTCQYAQRLAAVMAGEAGP